jgi:alpha-ketoglutarate-dependent taurine dioxygenase
MHTGKRAVPASPIKGAIAWTRAEIASTPWLIAPSSGVLQELESTAQRLSDVSEPEQIRSDAFELPATSKLMADILGHLQSGSGFAVLDQMPFAHWGEATACAVSWLLCDLIAPPVMQKWTGTRMYKVRDTGAKLGYGVRRSLTNLKQDLHTDAPWLGSTADFMALSCVKQAAEGGMSRITSLAAAHDWLLEHSPELLARLYQPYYWDRQAEHAPGDTPTSYLPIYSQRNGRVQARYYDDYIQNGYRLANSTLDHAGAEALAAMRSFVESAANCFEFRLREGQIFFLNNHLVAHGRSGFTDSPGANRLVLRFWLRTHGGIGFEPDAA